MSTAKALTIVNAIAVAMAMSMAEASAVQPFAYFQLAFAAVIGLSFFGETVRANVVLGAAIIVAAGLFTFWRERQQS